MDYEKKYKDALEWARRVMEGKVGFVLDEVLEKFPELKESEDEQMAKHIIDIVKCKGYDAAKDENFYAAEIAWLEKQGEQEQLYIRFGEIPTDEKSKIYQGEIEVGTENGTSVYPAFKTDKENIVLGLNLPITKTTLYTQQHLIEYDDRPCYLVKGNYVGKDTDGQPLINNVSIIKRIDNYRVKEEKQDKSKFEQCIQKGDKIVTNKDGTRFNTSQLERVAQKVAESKENAEEFLKSAEIMNGNHELADEYRLERQGWQKPADKVEPKFNFSVGQWIVATGKCVYLITKIDGFNVTLVDVHGDEYVFDASSLEDAHLWTIEDAKDGDVLFYKGNVKYSDGIKFDRILLFENLDKSFFVLTKCSNGVENYGINENIDYPDNIIPATKEQKEILFMVMKEVGYKWDAAKKELKKIESRFKVGYKIKKIGEEPRIITKIDEKGYWSEDLFMCGFDEECIWDLVEQKPTIEMITPAESLGIDSETYNKIVDECVYCGQNSSWSEEDERMLIDCTNVLHRSDYSTKIKKEIVIWLKSLKERMKGE